MAVERATRTVMVSPELMEAWQTFRTTEGFPVRIVWGEPNADGMYEPGIYRDACDHPFISWSDERCPVCDGPLP